MRNKSLRKYKFQIIAMLLAIIGLYLIVYFAPYGTKKYHTIKLDLATINSEISDLKEQNKTLKSEINKLKKDSVYIEKVAREQYGLLKKNEIVFEFKSKKTKEK